MKKFFHIFILSSLLLTGCYDDLRDQEQSRLADLRDVKIASLEDQVKEIMSSVTTLSQLSTEIGSYIANLQKINDDLKNNLAALNAGFEKAKSDLQSGMDASKAKTLAGFETAQAAVEAKIADMDAVISVLQSKKASIDSRLEALRSHADNDFATKDWVTETLVTFESQKAFQDDVAEIKAYVEKLGESLIAVENEISEILGSKLAEVSASLDASLKEEVEKLAQEYRTVAAALKEEVSKAFNEALATAISDSETKLKTWVSEQLADYWTVAEAKAALESFQTLVGNVPEGKDVQSQIEELMTAIGGIEAELTEAFTAAIKAAIEKSGSDMDQAVLDRVNEVKGEVSGLSTRIDTVEAEVKKLWTKVNELTSTINDIDGQFAAINTSIAVLSDLKMTLEEYIGSIRKTLSEKDTENYNKVNALIEALKNEVDSLQAQLDSLKAYVGTKPAGASSIVEWVEVSQQSVVEQLNAYGKTSRITDIKAEIESAIGTADASISTLSTAIDSKIQNSKSTIDAWIDARLSAYYHTAVEIETAFNTLRTTLKAEIDPKDSEIGILIDTLDNRLTKAVANFTKDYSAAIKAAIEGNAGVVTTTISDAVAISAGKVSALKDRLDAIDGEVLKIKQDLSTIKTNIGGMNTDIAKVQTFINNSGYQSLQQIVDYLTGELGKCAASYATIVQLNALKTVIYGDGTDANIGLKGEVAKLSDLTSRLEDVEDDADGLKTFIAGYGSTVTLASILAGIDTDIKNLQKDVFGDTTVTPNVQSLQTLIDNMLKSLYGEKDGKPLTAATADANSIYGRIKALAGDLFVRNFNSLEYLPNSADGCAIAKDGNIWSTQIDFVIRPASLVNLLNDDNCTLWVVSAQTRASDNPLDLQASIVNKDPSTGTFSAVVNHKNGGGTFVKPSFSNGYAVLYVDVQKDGKTLSFTSKYIPFKVIMN